MRLRKREIINVEVTLLDFYSPISAKSLLVDGEAVDWRWFETELGATAEHSGTSDRT